MPFAHLNQPSPVDWEHLSSRRANPRQAQPVRWGAKAAGDRQERSSDGTAQWMASSVWLIALGGLSSESFACAEGMMLHSKPTGTRLMYRLRCLNRARGSCLALGEHIHVALSMGGGLRALIIPTLPVPSATLLLLSSCCSSCSILLRFDLISVSISCFLILVSAAG